ncbi:MAG: DUF1287 domain-containing protein [Terriglobales bacterium]
MRIVVPRNRAVFAVLLTGCALATALLSQRPAPPPPSPMASAADVFTRRLVAAASERPTHTVRYDGAYVRLKYPGGDVPANVGVCTDEIIRIYRVLDIDLQKEVHEDMSRNFARYPRSFGLARPDSNIDHRRVPNLRVFFARRGESLPITHNAADYLPGDIVTWDLGGRLGRGLTHIGIVVDHMFGNRHGIVHNIGAGPQLEDVLFSWKITGHYRYRGPAASAIALRE